MVRLLSRNSAPAILCTHSHRGTVLVGYSRSLEKHLEHLRLVLTALRENRFYWSHDLSSSKRGPLTWTPCVLVLSRTAGARMR